MEVRGSRNTLTIWLPDTFTPRFHSLQAGQAKSATESRGSPDSRIIRLPDGNGSHSTIKPVWHRWQQMKLRIVRALLIATEGSVGLISFLQKVRRLRRARFGSSLP